MKEEKIIDLAEDRVNKIIDKFESNNICWLSSQETDIDESVSYCYNCASKNAKRLTKKLKKNVIVDGGWGMQEDDTCVHCADCQKILNYNLTEHGCKSELDHFLSEDVKIELDSVEEALHIRNVLTCYKVYDEQKVRILDLARKVLQNNFWYKIKDPSKFQYCNSCGRHHHIWCCETFLDISHLQEKENLTDDECFFVNKLYLCSWHKGSDKHFIKNLNKPKKTKR